MPYFSTQGTPGSVSQLVHPHTYLAVNKFLKILFGCESVAFSIVWGQSKDHSLGSESGSKLDSKYLSSDNIVGTMVVENDFIAGTQ